MAKTQEIFFPTAYVKIGKFGKSDSDLLFQDVVEGNAFQLADFTIEVLEKKYLISPISYEGLHRIEGSEYPYKAVREMLLNAIIHRTYTSTPIQMSVYDDKLMIWNEGTLPENLTIESLKHKHPSYPKNPNLADTCFKGGLIEAWGRGTLKIIEECKAFGLPEPEIAIMSGGICVTLFKDIYNEHHLKSLNLNDRQLKAVFYIKENSKITNKEYQEINSVSKATATRDLTELTELLKNFEKKGETGVGTYYKLKGS